MVVGSRATGWAGKRACEEPPTASVPGSGLRCSVVDFSRRLRSRSPPFALLSEEPSDRRSSLVSVGPSQRVDSSFTQPAWPGNFSQRDWPGLSPHSVNMSSCAWRPRRGKGQRGPRRVTDGELIVHAEARETLSSGANDAVLRPWLIGCRGAPAVVLHGPRAAAPHCAIGGRAAG